MATSTVEEYRVRPRQPPSPVWGIFLKNHVMERVVLDFFTVPTIGFTVLFVLIVLAPNRRKVLHLNGAEHPTAQWTAQQLVEAFPWDMVPKYLLRDRDAVYGERFQRRAANLGIDQLLTAPRSPWQIAYAERMIGSIRRDCLDQVMVFSEGHLRRLLTSYSRNYHRGARNLLLAMDYRSVQEQQGSTEAWMSGMSASWFRTHMASMEGMFIKDGVRILTRVGVSLPSEAR